jgi:hypothetical protein
MSTMLRFLLLMLCCLPVLSGFAQESLVLLPGESQIIRVSADQPTELLFEIDQPQTWIEVSARALQTDDPLLDPVVWVTAPDYRLLAYDDNGAPEDDINPHIAALKLETAASYRLFVDTFSGVGAGDVEITLTILDPFAIEPIASESGEALHIWLPQGEIFRMEIPVNAGETLTIRARDLSGTLDPLLRLRDASGVLLAQNDDHGSSDTRLNVLDAQLAGWQSGQDQVIQIEVLDFLGRSGRFELLIQR